MLTPFKLYIVILLITQAILAVPKGLRKRGIIFFVFGFAVRKKVITKPMEGRIRISDKISIAISVVVIGISYFLLFSWDKVEILYVLGDETWDYILTLDIIQLYGMLILLLIIFGPFHEYMHFHFARRVGVPIRYIYLIFIMGIPVAFAIRTKEKRNEEVGALQIMVTISGGIIANVTYVFLATTLYMLHPSIPTKIFLFFSIYIMVVNSIAFLYYFKTDGTMLIIQGLEAFIKNKKMARRLSRLIIILAISLQIIFFPKTFYLGGIHI